MVPKSHVAALNPGIGCIFVIGKHWKIYQKSTYFGKSFRPSVQSSCPLMKITESAGSGFESQHELFPKFYTKKYTKVQF